MLPITTSTSDELFSRINIDDFERPWTSKIRGFYWLSRSSAAAHTMMKTVRLQGYKSEIAWAYCGYTVPWTRQTTQQCRNSISGAERRTLTESGPPLSTTTMSTTWPSDV